MSDSGDLELTPTLAKILSQDMSRRIREKQEKLTRTLALIHNDFLAPVHEAMNLFLATYPEIEAVSITTCGDAKNNRGWDGFGLRGIFFRIRDNHQLIYTTWAKQERTAIRAPGYRGSEALSHWSFLWDFHDELYSSIRDYLFSGEYLLLPHGDNALLVWTPDEFRVHNVVDSDWDAYAG